MYSGHICIKNNNQETYWLSHGIITNHKTLEKLTKMLFLPESSLVMEVMERCSQDVKIHPAHLAQLSREYKPGQGESDSTSWWVVVCLSDSWEWLAKKTDG